MSRNQCAVITPIHPEVGLLLRFTLSQCPEPRSSPTDLDLQSLLCTCGAQISPHFCSPPCLPGKIYPLSKPIPACWACGEGRGTACRHDISLSEAQLHIFAEQTFLKSCWTVGRDSCRNSNQKKGPSECKYLEISRAQEVRDIFCSATKARARLFLFITYQSRLWGVYFLLGPNKVLIHPD
jgi:hypothetical protein